MSDGLGKGDHLYLVDGSGYIFRAYHALPPLTRKSDGLPIGQRVLAVPFIWPENLGSTRAEPSFGPGRANLCAKMKSARCGETPGAGLMAVQGWLRGKCRPL